MNTPHMKEATVTWSGEGLAFESTLGSGFEVRMGGGAEADAASPMELLLASVAGCTAMDIVHVLRKMREPLRGLTVGITGDRASENPKVYTDVKIVYTVTGEDVRPAAVERAIALSQESYCSASVMLQRAGVQITTEYHIRAQ